MTKKLAALVVLAAGSAISAQTIQYPFDLSGVNEVPANASPGFGSAIITLNTVTGGWTLTGNYSGMVGSVVAAHIHAAPVGANGSVLFALTQTGGTSGTLSGSGTFSSAQIQLALTNGLYVNVHSTVFPGGEIRGQLIPTPGAASVLGLAGLAAMRRRR